MVMFEIMSLLAGKYSGKETVGINLPNVKSSLNLNSNEYGFIKYLSPELCMTIILFNNEKDFCIYV